MAKKIVSHVSPTQIGQFYFCPVSYKYYYVDGIKPEFRDNIYTVYGSALHEALAFNYNQKILSRKDLNYLELYNDIFLKEFEKGVNKLRIPAHDYQYREMIVVTEMVMKNYMEKIAPGIQPILVEHRFEIALKKYPIKIVGIFDLVTEDGFVIDHKTAGKTYKKTWTQKAVDGNLQFTFYAAAYRKMFGKKEAGIRADIIPRLAGVDPMIITSQRSDDDIRRILDTATAIEKITAFGMFIPNTANCGVCPLKNTCPKQVIQPTKEDLEDYQIRFGL